MILTNPFKNIAIFAVKTLNFSPIMAGAIALVCFLGIMTPLTTHADFQDNICLLSLANAKQAAKNAVNPVKSPRSGVSSEAGQFNGVKKIKVIITAYSSAVEETDDTPFITASGKEVRDGIVANNMLPMGTKIKIPELYGDKVFVIEDRMNRRKSNYHIDIWFPSKMLALNFGVKTAEIEVLED